MKQVFILIAISGILFSSCVSSKKYKAANAQIASQNSQIEGLNKQVTTQQQTIDQLKKENIQYGKEAEDCRKAKEAIRQRLDNLDAALAEQKTSMKKIQENIEKDFQPFADMGADVTYEDGLVHINFTDKFFFKEGSSTIGTNGRVSLNTVAQVLRDFPKVTCYIVGNTDTLHVKGKADNWSLSTERANAVVRILSDVYNINPARLTSAGKGKYSPVASNATPEGREKNRRIEIIFNPDLEKLWDLTEKK